MTLPRFGLRRLFLLTLACACCAAFTTWVIAARKHARQQAGLGIQSKVEHWPYVLRNLLKDAPSLGTGVTPCGLTAGFDQSSIWRVNSDAPIIDFLKSQQNLEVTNRSHPKANYLIKALPVEWPKQNWKSSTWYATPGFGTQHIEVTDLYLMAIDSDTGDAIVYHENHF